MSDGNDDALCCFVLFELYLACPFARKEKVCLFIYITLRIVAYCFFSFLALFSFDYLFRGHCEVEMRFVYFLLFFFHRVCC